MEFSYLKEIYLKDVTDIIVNKYQDAREKMFLLSNKYENWEKQYNRLKQFVDDQTFVVGLEEGKVISFMKAFEIDHYKGTAKGALVLPSFHGVARGQDTKKVHQLMYKHLSNMWVNTQCYTHSILIYANETEVLDTWFYNGFGIYVIDAVRNLDPIPVPNKNDGLVIRQARKSDINNMTHLIKAINQHLYDAPIFLYDSGDEDEVLHYQEWLDEENNILWLAEYNQEIVGFLKTNTTEINQDELNDGETMGINGAFVKPEQRGNHIMSRLINEALVWAKEKGLKRCSTDFETANVEGSRFWLKHFKPYSYALMRRIDERNHLKILNEKEGDKNV